MNWTEGKKLFRDYAFKRGKTAEFSHFEGQLQNIYIENSAGEIETDVRIFNSTQAYAISYPKSQYTHDIEFHKALLQVMIDLGWDRE